MYICNVRTPAVPLVLLNLVLYHVSKNQSISHDWYSYNLIKDKIKRVQIIISIKMFNFYCRQKYCNFTQSFFKRVHDQTHNHVNLLYSLDIRHQKFQFFRLLSEKYFIEIEYFFLTLSIFFPCLF